MWPIVVAWIVRAGTFLFSTRIGLMIASALAWAGLTYGTTKILIEPALAAIQAQMQALNSTGGQWAVFIIAAFGILKVDVAMTMIFSAIVTRTGIAAAHIRLFPAVGRGTGF